MTQQTDTDTAVQESVDYKIKDINLAEFGKKEVEIAQHHLELRSETG